MWQGDIMTPDKPDGTTRFLFQNVRGLKKNSKEDTLEDIVRLQQSLAIDFLGMSEHHQDTSKISRKMAMSDTVHRASPGQAACRFDSSQESTTTGHQNGGTGITVIGPLASQLDANGRGGDDMGRWSYVHLRRKASAPITVFSIYQVCKSATNVIGQTALHQQERALALAGRTIHPRDAFITDLIAQVKHFQSHGHDIIIGGDFNETVEDSRSGVLRLMTATNLSDPWYLLNPDAPTFRTQETGSKRIDSVCMSEGLIPCIAKLGYAPFDRFLNSDHRGLFIEFDTHKLLGLQTDTLPSMPKRAVQTSDKRSVTKFVEQMYDHLLANDAFSKRTALDSDTLTPAEVERLDNNIGDAGTSGEAHCRRRRTEWYSHELVQARFQVQVLRSQLSALRHGKHRLPGLLERIHSTGLDFDIPTTIPALRIALQKAEKRLQRKQSASESIRRAELNAKSDSATNARDDARARILKRINKFETSRKTWSTMDRIANSQGNIQRLDRLEVPLSWPDPDTPPDGVHVLESPADCISWKMITDPLHIEYYLMLRNRIHFGQAQGTPFTCSPLSDQVDWEASTPFVEDILTGAFKTTVTTSQCAQLLSECQATSTLDAVPATLSPEDFSGKIKKWRESTTTSPSGRHLGRYKALFSRGTYNPDTDPEAAQDFSDKQQAIADLILSVLNYCIRNKHVLNRWKSIVNTMIFKDVGEYKIHRLRVIHIYEADFNLLLAVKWRQLLHHADNHGLIHAGQYGGRPGCEAQSLTFLEELKYDISYVSRRSLFNFDNDATSCYDRIIVALASLINRKYGHHRSIVAVHAKTLKEARYKLRTAIGISELEYSHCEAFPIHGTGQGSGNSPSIWLFISATLFDAHAKQAYGATFTTPDGSHTARLTMVGFVDDSTGTCNDFQPQAETSLDDLIERMQHDAQVWNDLLFCSGGRLELKKCSFHVLNFSFKPDGTPVPLLDVLDNRIHITDSLTGTPLPIEAKGARDPHKTLGHIKSPVEPQTPAILSDPSTPRAPTQLQMLTKKAKTMSTKISMSPIQRSGAFLAYHAMYLASVKYALPQSFFRSKTLYKAQRQSMGAIIAKCGLTRTTPTALVYAPTEFAGGGFVLWYTLQGEGQITLFLKHWRTGTVISEVLRIDLSWHQWQSGLAESILIDVTTPLPHLEGRWLPSLREFLRTINGQLRVDENFVALLQRQGDCHIMSYAVHCGKYSPKDLRILNYCRLFLHVVTISDLFNSAGTRILSDVWNCNRAPWFDPTQIITLQKRPSHYQIKKRWQQLLQTWCDELGIANDTLNLGHWLHPGDQLHLRRETYIVHGPSPFLYHWKIDRYWEYRHIPLTRKFQPTRATTWIPTSAAIPVDASISADDVLLVTSQYHPFPAPSLPPLAHDFQDYLTTIPEWERPLLAEISFLLEPYLFMDLISQFVPGESLLVVSDGGSIPDVTMSYGVVIGSSSGDIYIENSGIPCGEPSSFRAEATGQLSGLRILHHLTTYTGIPLPPDLAIKAYSDNAGLIKRDNARIQYKVVYPNATLASDWDLTEAIHSTFDVLNHHQMTYSWVKGHQDRNKLPALLPIEACFNIRADELATQAMIGHPTNPRLTPLYPRTRCIFDLDGRSVHAHYTTAIRRAAAEPEFYSYLESKHQWTTTTRKTVDWPSFRQAAKTYPTSDVHCLKLVHDKLPTQSFKSKMEEWSDANCPLCKCPETFDHIMTCPNPLSQTFRATLETTVTKYCDQHQAPLSFTRLYTACLSTWLHGADPTDLHPIIGPAQQRIGWRLLPRGFLTVAWRDFLATTLHQSDLESMQQSLEESFSSGSDELEFFLDTPEDPTSRSFTATSNPKAFLAGLIKIVWTDMSTLWQQHLDALHAHATDTSSPAKRQELITCIRLLHQKRQHVLPEHRDRYFHSNLDEYLETAASSTLTDYLHNYLPVIAASMREFSKRNDSAPSLLTFAGFTRAPRTIIPHPTIPIPTEGTPIHHKHSRWRHHQQSLHEFFPPS